jgi:hypothetical protein
MPPSLQQLRQVRRRFLALERLGAPTNRGVSGGVPGVFSPAAVVRGLLNLGSLSSFEKTHGPE